jgi:hypothetical protein
MVLIAAVPRKNLLTFFQSTARLMAFIASVEDPCMAFMEWNSGLSVQVATFDEQHKKLLGMVNRLHEAMLQRTGREALAAIFSDLIAYTGTHFADEEAAMKSITTLAIWPILWNIRT